MTTESDRELLELAAKAAGIELKWHSDGTAYARRNGDYWAVWNPMRDDGDALRLAVKLRIHVRHFSHDVEAQVERGYWHEFDGPDPYAATRRAIVRAAAEIGRSMQATKDVPTYSVTVIDNKHPEGIPYEQWATPKWKGLTDAERYKCTQSPFVAENYHAIEAALKEKNT